MPLIHSKSKEALSQNIATEIKAGKPRAQAIAIGYSVQRHAFHDDLDERRIERQAHEKFKYGRGSD